MKKPWNYGSSAIIAGSCGLLQLAAVVRNGFTCYLSMQPVIHDDPFVMVVHAMAALGEIL